MMVKYLLNSIVNLFLNIRELGPVTIADFRAQKTI